MKAAAITLALLATAWTAPKPGDRCGEPWCGCWPSRWTTPFDADAHRARYLCMAEEYDRREAARGPDEFSTDACRAQCAREGAALGPNVIYDCWCLDAAPPRRSWPFVAMHADRDQTYCHESERPCMHPAFYLKRGPGYRGEYQPVIFKAGNVLRADGRPVVGGERAICPVDGVPLAIDPIAQTMAPGRNRLVIVERATGKRWEAGKPLPERGQ